MKQRTKVDFLIRKIVDAQVQVERLCQILKTNIVPGLDTDDAAYKQTAMKHLFMAREALGDAEIYVDEIAARRKKKTPKRCHS